MTPERKKLIGALSFVGGGMTALLAPFFTGEIANSTTDDVFITPMADYISISALTLGSVGLAVASGGERKDKRIATISYASTLAGLILAYVVQVSHPVAGEMIRSGTEVSLGVFNGVRAVRMLRKAS